MTSPPTIRAGEEGLGVSGRTVRRALGRVVKKSNATNPVNAVNHEPEENDRDE